MKFEKTNLTDVHIIKLEPKKDERGLFTRLFCKKELAAQDIPFSIVQINLSINKQKGIIRGMHFQKSPKGEDKIVQCLKGKIYDVVLDLRPGSRTCGKWFATQLSESDLKSIYIPKGCAHGFQTLTETCEILYLISEFYSPKHYSGIRWNDPFFGIKWPIPNPILSSQDQNWPLFESKK